MDPNETLRRLRQLVDELEPASEDPEPGEYYRIASEATVLFDALDGWLSRGGLLPRDWTTGQVS